MALEFARRRLRWLWEMSSWKTLRTLDAVYSAKAAQGMVSVLIPALEDRASLLDKRCLPSIERQTFQNFEVIVVSETYSPEIDAAVSRRGGAYRYFWGTRKSKALSRADSVSLWCSGAAPNLNLAMKMARGEFFARMDDDDEWLPNHLDSAVRALTSSQSDFVSSNAFSASGGLLPVVALDDFEFGDEYRWRAIQGSVGTTITWLYRRHLRSYRFNENSWRKSHNRPVDYDFMLRIAAGGARMHFNAEVTARECIRPGANGLTGHRAHLVEFEARGGHGLRSI